MPQKEDCKYCMYQELVATQEDSLYCHYHKRDIHFNNYHCEEFQEDYIQKERVSIIQENPPINNEKIFQRPFSFHGRIGRTEYSLSIIIGIATYLFLQFFNPFLIGLLSFIYLWFLIAQSIKRCHDIGSHAFYILIPFYQLWLLFINSDEGINHHGSEPNKKYEDQIKTILPNFHSTSEPNNDTILLHKTQKESLKVTNFKIISFLFSFSVIVTFIIHYLNPYLSKFEEPQYSHINWMILPITIVVGFIFFKKIRYNNIFLHKTISYYEKIVNTPFSIARKTSYIICIWMFFSILSIVSSTLAIYSIYLCSYDNYINCFFIPLGIIGIFLSMSYFSYISSTNITNSKQGDFQYFEKTNDCTDFNHSQIKEDIFSHPNERDMEKINNEVFSTDTTNNSEILTSTKNERKKKTLFNFSSIINYYFPFHKGYRRLLFICWVTISIVTEVSQWGRSSHYWGWGIISLIILIIIYLAAFWVYNGFQEANNKKK